MSSVIRNYWYQEPWAWFNILLLTIAVVAASLMSVVAMRHSPAEIGSRWYNDGALAKRERHQEVMIGAIHLQGQLTLAEGGVVELTLRHDAIYSDNPVLKEIDAPALQLYIEHPTDPEQDQMIEMKRVDAEHYSGKLRAALSGKRRLLISPDSDRWYLTASAYFPLANELVFLPEMS